MKAKTRTPRQQRSIDTRARLLEAARALFAEEGFHAANTKRIAARAGVSVGSLYAYFRDKKELFLAVMEDYNRAVAGRIAFPRPDPALLAEKERALAGLIRGIFGAHELDPGFHREVMLLGQTDPDVRRAMDELEREQRAMALRYLAAWRGQIEVGDLEAAAFIIFGAVEAAAHALALGETDLDRERLIRELTAMILRYLFPGEGGAARGNDKG